MHFSVWPSPARPVDEILELARFADTGPWTGIWFADHYMPNTDDGTVADGDVHEAWSVLPAIAAVTERIRLGPLVAPTTVHHPALLANRASTIDHLSHGRFVLGLGAGWQVNEHRAYGIELYGAKDRVDRFEEAIQIVRLLLDEPRTTFDGRHFQITDAPAQPRPVQERLPILVGPGGDRMLRITARHAEEWNTWGTPEVVADRTASLERACSAVGRDPATIVRSCQALVFMVDDAEGAAKLDGVVPADRSVVGTPEQLVEAIARYAELGIDELIVPDFTLGTTADERRTTYERIATEIIPAFKG